MVKSLRPIRNIVGEELREFQHHFNNTIKSNIFLVDKIMKYIVKTKGKQVRPLFVFLCAKLCGQPNNNSNIAASLIELLHTASLIHDDVVDDAYKRRGFFSINALWKNKIAVLGGDFLVSKGFLEAIENKQFKILEIASEAIREMMEGEILQIEKARKLDITEEVYFEVIHKKTASLISAACCAGAYSVTEDSEISKKLKAFGTLAGLAFQIKDDLLDYGSYDIGKPRGIDLKDKKLTLPIIHVLSKADKKTKRWIIREVKRRKQREKEIRNVVAYVYENGGIEYAEHKMKQLKNEALDILDGFPDSEAKEGLHLLLEFVVNRKK